MKIRNVNIKSMVPYFLISPALILFAAFLFFPVASVFYNSLFNYSLYKPDEYGFIAFKNIITILTKDKLFYKSLGITGRWVVSTVSLQFILGLITALILNRKFFGRGLARTFIIAPWAISSIVTAMMWFMVYNEHIGILNDILLRLGLIKQGIAWVARPSMALGAVVVAEAWRGMPFFSIILLAALQNIPIELYESCSIDGGNRRQAFIYITLPFLKETILFSILLRSIWEFNHVDLIFALTGGGPVNRTMTLSMYIVQNAIEFNNFGYGSALVVVAFFILLIMVALYLKISGFNKEDEVL